jgi:uncharacterized membrane protein
MPAMTAPPVGKRGFVSLSAVLVVVLVAGVANAEVVFRKKAPPAENTEASPSGGELGTEAAPKGEAEPATSIPQAEDKDFPEAQAQRDKARADAALARQMKNAELAKKREEGTPFYQKWQFWAITGGAVVGAVLLIWGGSALVHSMNGGDVRACPMEAGAGCYGEGR